MVPKKLVCRRLLLGCFGAGSKAEPMLPEPEHRASGHHRHSHSRPLVPRISLSDLSDPGDLSSSVIGSNLHCFTRSELKVITHGFSVTNILGEGGFGPVYKGFVDNKLRPGLKPQPVAVKVLNLEGTQGHKEWLAEVIFLGQLKHPNLVRLIGYCFEDEQRFLVYEYMVRGNLDNHLFRKYSATLPWSTRVKIALEAAKSLAFLHEGDKPVIYRDFKASNILLDSDYTAKLSDFGLAKDGPDGDDTHVTTRVVGTHGYAAPEYIKTGHLTMMSDVYSYGVVLLELLTGRRSLDKSRPRREKSLVDWAGPLLKEPRKLDRLMDPRLEGQYSVQGARKAAALAHQCLSHHRESRPTMSTVVKRLEALVEMVDVVGGPFVYVVPGEAEKDENDGEEGSSKGEKEGGKGRDEVKRSVVGVRHRKGRHRHRHRQRYHHPMRSRAIHSDPALYRY